MRVLQINVVCGIRSTGRICTDIAEHLTTNGHECRIAYGREIVQQKHQEYAIRIGNNFDIQVHGLQARVFDKAGFGSKHATEKFIEWVIDYNPDIIHIHNIHGYYINIEILFSYLKVCGKPIIWTLHDCWPFTGHCTHFEYVGCNKWKNECYRCPQKKRYPASYILDNSNTNFQRKKALFTKIYNLTIVTPSIWLKNIVAESFLSDYEVYIINNGVDLGIFKPIVSDFKKKHNIEYKEIVLGVASTWDDRKGLHDFLLLSKMLTDNYKIVLVGLTPKQLENLPSNILGFSKTNNMSELAEIYSAADVFVNPTYEDNYPTVNIEARACGIPVITYETGGSPESAGTGSVRVKKGDINALHQKIIKKHIAPDSQMTAVSKEHMLQEYLALYKRKGQRENPNKSAIC